MLAGCNLMFSSALRHLPLTDATAIGFASPLFTVALAAVWLREKVGRRRWLGVGIGLAGVLVALRPPFLTGGEPVHWAAILPLGTAAMFAVYQILTRKLAAIDDPRTTILHTGFAGAVATSLVQPLSGSWPVGLDWGLLVLLGLLGALGHGLLVLAYARAPVSLLAPLSYTQLVWATLSGVLVFADWPDGWTLLGAAGDRRRRNPGRPAGSAGQLGQSSAGDRRRSEFPCVTALAGHCRGPVALAYRFPLV